MIADENTSADPTPALELLWGTRERPSRGPRQGLTPDRIVEAAIEIADSEGLAALSMRRVASRLGVGAATLYTYVPGKTELYALMIDAMVGSGPLPHTLPGGWRERFEAWAREDWTGFREHPWLLRIVSDRPVPGPNTLAWFDSAIRALDGTGLTGPEKATVVEVVDGYVRGLARTSLDTAEAERRSGVSETAWTSLANAFMARHVDFSAYPHLVEATAESGMPGPEEVFEFGLQRLLDGVEEIIRDRAACAGRAPE
ncbi:TetR/AcrR family transcriptional regulator [Nocardiopsis sediminis]|uniref:TetR/AcrR family transcriptional regulator n=1 Tax=Nocardiopsis sediminis TaxID=1778267 RepID=A0ABV8FTS9_9ACTN